MRAKMDSAEETAAQLPCWLGPVRPFRLKGGISNENFLVDDQGRKFVVKINGDVPERGVWRTNDIVCNRAAAAGVAPEVHHSEAEAIVVAYVNGRNLNVADVRDDGNLARILTIVRRTHNDLLAANLIDDGEHLWLIDWEHAGLTSPLFDLANLSSNNVLSNSQE